jgi:hypothetical protein
VNETLLDEKQLEDIFVATEKCAGSASALRSIAFARIEAQEIPGGILSVLSLLVFPHPVAKANKPVKRNVIPRFMPSLES